MARGFLPTVRKAASPSRRPAAAGALLAGALAACGPMATAGPGCGPILRDVALPGELREASGVAPSLDHPGVYWIHNDSGSLVHAVDREGRIVARVRLSVALRDWEDLALAGCPGGGSCLYAADLGDNYEERPGGAVIRFREPDPASPPTGPVPADVFPVRLPDGPRDIEALLVLPGERILVVTKGRNHPVTVYRYPPPLRPDTVVLEEVQRLTGGPVILPRQVTGGSVSPRGGVVVLRTYRSMRFYNTRADTLAEVEGSLVNLRTLREAQGEGVGLGLDGLVALASEGGPGGGPGALSLLRCRVPGL